MTPQTAYERAAEEIRGKFVDRYAYPSDIELILRKHFPEQGVNEGLITLDEAKKAKGMTIKPHDSQPTKLPNYKPYKNRTQ